MYPLLRDPHSQSRLTRSSGDSLWFTTRVKKRSLPCQGEVYGPDTWYTPVRGHGIHISYRSGSTFGAASCLGEPVRRCLNV